ncbi:hypothetical protein THIOKS13290005 [Thiocapsa sp. KS1]|nr:hypothetical protein THIOKS13290005 [Thiocapsa sp. KS1]
MKPKPDVSSFDGLSKDPSDFLDGARTESPGRPAVGTPTPAPVQPETREVTLAVAKPEPTVPKMFRLRWGCGCGVEVWRGAGEHYERSARH